MALINKPHTHTPNTLAESAKVNANDETIYNEFNGNIDDANIKALANISHSKIGTLVNDLAARLLKAGDTMTGVLKLAFDSPSQEFQGTSGLDWRIIKLLGVLTLQRNDGTVASPTWVTVYQFKTDAIPTENSDVATKLYADSRVQNRAVADVTVGNTVSETTLYTFAVPASTLSTNKRLRLIIVGSFRNDAATPTTFTIRLKYGATTIATIVKTLNIGITAGSFFEIEALLNAKDVTVQQGTVKLTAIDVNAGSVAFVSGNRGTAAENSATELNLVVTAQWGVADADNTITAEHATLELL